jgi:hypothetical protein
MDNLSWGNPVAHRVRVHYNTASKTIYEGMPVCYNYDTTRNWAGGSSSNGAVTTSSSLTAGTPETAAAKYLEVEEPNDGNLQFFAGVVAKGSWCGKTTSSTAGVGITLDIYVPNGAIVPVRAGVGCTNARTILSVIAATQYLGHALSATEARPVAIVEETVDRSTAGLILAKLDPNLFIYQEQHGSALLSGTGATAASASQIINRINVSSAQTAGTFRALQMKAELTGTGHCAYGMYKLDTTINAAMSNLVHAVSIGLTLGASTELYTSYADGNCALRIKLNTSGTPNFDGDGIFAISIQNYLAETGGAPLYAYPFLFHCDTSCQWDGLFKCDAANLGIVAATGDTAHDSSDVCIPILVGTTTYYIVAQDSLG